MVQIAFARHSYQSRSLPLSAQRLVNFYPEISPPDAKSQLAIFGTPGLKLFTTTGVGPVRGKISMSGMDYTVSGAELYSTRSNGVSTLEGAVPGAGRVSMAHNGTQIVIVTNPDAYVFDVSDNSLSQITDPDFPGASTVTYQDGYFIFSRPDTGQFFLSALLDGRNYDALDFATAEGAPDDMVAVFSDHRELLLFGERTIEVWLNTGASPFPFERIPNVFIERGCSSPFSIAKADNSVYWQGNDGITYRLEEHTPVRISQHGQENAIAKYADKQGAGFVYSQEGHIFYVLVFNEGTWVYDPASQLWHERQSLGLTRWRANAASFSYGKSLVGDFENGNVYELDLDTYSDNGTEIMASAASAPIGDGSRRLRMGRLEIIMETGVGLATGQGIDPRIMLDWSDDGGRTWSNEHWRSMGRIDQNRHRAVWNRLGSFYSRVLRVSIADPVKRAIIKADADIS